MPSSRVRVDQRVVELGLETTRSRAHARILAGDVRLGDRVMDKPGNLIPGDAMLTLKARSRYVSRGGEKLRGALDELALDVQDFRCADVGASTGGFTDCLLQAGATSVRAIDVGYGQLALTLRDDPRVCVQERTNVRHLETPTDEERVDLVTADVSFISLRLVLPKLIELAKPGGRLLLMVKPQFELERKDVRGGVVRDPVKREAAVRSVRNAAQALGLRLLGECDSVLAGPKGNVERFLLLEVGQPTA